MTLLDSEEVLSKLLMAVKTRQPFYVARLGDGEYEIVRGMLGRNTKMLKERMSRWVSTAQMTTEEIYEIGESIVTSYSTADIVGVPNVVERTYPKWACIKNALPRIVDKKALLCDFNSVTHIDYRGLFASGQLLSIGLVSSRVEQVKSRLIAMGLCDIAVFEIAPETFSYSAAFNDVIREGKTHYPDRFQEFPSWAKFVLRRPRVIFIGAGGFGKIYGAIVKKYGGIAVDIGALFDGWCGCATRPYLEKSIERFVL